MFSLQALAPLLLPFRGDLGGLTGGPFYRDLCPAEESVLSIVIALLQLNIILGREIAVTRAIKSGRISSLLALLPLAGCRFLSPSDHLRLALAYLFSHLVVPICGLSCLFSCWKPAARRRFSEKSNFCKIKPNLRRNPKPL
jgi:hypothetical protein